jgi:hypothetical protein
MIDFHPGGAMLIVHLSHRRIVENDLADRSFGKGLAPYAH